MAAAQTVVSFRLDGQAALVTGAGGGLGGAVAKALASAGAAVAVADLSLESVEPLADEIRGAGGRGLALRLDVSDPEDVRRAVQEVARELGGLHVLVNCAGVVLPASALETTPDQWARTLSVNVVGTANCCQAAAEVMRRQGGGRIVNFASTFSEVGYPGRTTYAASKGAVRQMTRVMALEWAEHGITVNAVSPTAIRTPMTKGLMEDPEALARLVSRIPMGRIGEPEDVAGAVVFLASPAANFITGINLLVDGGWTAI